MRKRVVAPMKPQKITMYGKMLGCAQMHGGPLQRFLESRCVWQGRGVSFFMTWRPRCERVQGAAAGAGDGRARARGAARGVGAGAAYRARGAAGAALLH